MTRNIAANAAAAGKRMRKPRHAHSNRQDASTMLSTISAVRPSAFQKASKPGRAASASAGWSTKPTRKTLPAQALAGFNDLRKFRSWDGTENRTDGCRALRIHDTEKSPRSMIDHKR